MNDNRSEVVARVAKLLRLAGNNPSEAEAATAAAMAQSLMDKHGLSAAAVAVAGDTIERAAVLDPFMTTSEGGEAASLGSVPRGNRWLVRLAMGLAKSNGCSVYYWNATPKGKPMHLCGRPSDVETVRYLFSWLAPVVGHMVARKGRGLGLVWRSEYGAGIVETVLSRMSEQRTATAAEVRSEHANNPGALMRINTTLARFESDARGADEHARRLLGLRSGRSYHQSNASARESGRRDGASVALRSAGALGTSQRMLGRG